MAAGIVDRIAEGPGISDALPRNDTDPSETPKAEEPKALTAEDAARIANEIAQPLKDKLNEQDHELNFLRGRFQERQQAPATPTPVTPVTEKPRGFLESTPRERIIEGLRNEATSLDTLVAIIKDVVKPATEKVEAVDQRVSNSESAVRMRQEAEVDFNQMMEDYGHLKGNKEFMTAADSEFNQMRASGYRPGMAYQAAARTYNRMVREGKLQAPAQNGAQAQETQNNNQNGTASIARTLRDQNSHGAENSSGARSGEGGSGGEPQTLADLVSRGFYTQKDVAAVNKIMKSYGMDEKTWVRNYWADKKDNPRFGER